MADFDLNKVHEQVSGFKGKSLALTVSTIETSLRGASADVCAEVCSSNEVNSALLESCLVLKRAAGQINELVHAIGILISLPRLLKEGERVEELSLAAGNTGKSFDLQTNRQIAEFTFIDWKGGPEVIRQNKLFKDFYNLAECTTDKKRFIYTLGLDYPMKFFNGGRALKSVMSRHNKMWKEFQNRYGTQLKVVRDYYNLKKDDVQIEDLSEIVPGFAGGFS